MAPEPRFSARFAMNRVIVYTSNLLPLSETFIKEQLLALRRWSGVLVGVRQLNELPLDGIDIRVLRPDRPALFDRILWRLSKSLGTVPRSAVKRLRKEGASLVHVHFGVEAVGAWPLAKALDLPMLVTLHGYDINVHRECWEAGGRGQALRNYPARLLELARQPRV